MTHAPSVPIARSRIAVGSCFFLIGLCFSSWCSRIPAVQRQLGLDDVTLGTLLFALPLGSMLASVIAPWFVERYGAKTMLTGAFVLHSFTIVGVGLARSPEQLAFGLVCFGGLSNIVNISVNTQAIGIEQLMQRSVMASCHGLWSVAGCVGAAIAMAMIALGLSPAQHFALIAVLVWIGLALNYSSLLPHTPRLATTKAAPFGRPNKSLVALGLIAFAAMVCEGTMFDWGGLYWQNVIKARPTQIGLGYGAFMTAMAAMRFIADHCRETYGLKRMLLLSGGLITCGFLLSAGQPSLQTGLIGFLVVGAGTSSVVPLVVGQAGKDRTVSSSLAIATVSTIGFVGFLIGPPLIGWISGAMGLRVAFLLNAIMGLVIVLLTLQHFGRKSAISSAGGRTGRRC